MKLGVTLLLLLLLAILLPASRCGSPYRILLDLVEDLDRDGSFVEIGSDRGEGSTAFLWSLSSQLGSDFFSVDFSQEGYENARRVCSECAHRELGEQFLKENFPNLSNFGRVSFAYLDNYDWIWAGEHPDSYKHVYPTMISDHDLSQYKFKMRKEYEQQGLTLNNQKSQEAHLEQAKVVDRLCTDRCIILFDDTFQIGGGRYSGKGGAALRYLLEGNRFEVIMQSSPSAPSYDGFVMVRKLAVSDEGGPEPRPQSEADANGSSARDSVPQLQLLSPGDRSGVSCCAAQVVVEMTGAVQDWHTLVVYVDYLETFRKIDWSEEQMRGTGEKVKFEVFYDERKHKDKPVTVSFHIVMPCAESSVDCLDLQVISNSTFQFNFQ
mmetsp:Transcript_45914/g.144042  ORF Transcript_45914/g.144042 Transcript_45914/m.144042 type:complete len:379 (-) Transcript_45914:31-1167(-)